MNPYPLYDEVCSKIKEDFIPPDNLIAPRIVNLSAERLEELHLLIVHHAYKNNVFPKNKTIPYSGKIFSGDKGAQYSLSEIPLDLKKILWAYLES